ncbi:hypothetical protein OO007_12475 [Cocleimonas sp. KMM 6892]|uniref:hypothetical protein n=1 Tax=unclassified Cocleimonas TaxID=2639732 RepID=UPI002DBDA75B|nr:MULTISPECIES: hypothetical protein [unclassified Cocleimonas]MEB8433045.1 hypothetical protein [Cocleimonas sp. KMM 6892]MEC4715974.1 hypothetical protein [Cocleimonas sp. KMM 6895]MEC4745435.1 hypothetical protein [Cocleimonas sp. KMM 6896]
MIEIKHFSLVLFSTFFLAACGGGSSSSGDSVDVGDINIDIPTDPETGELRPKIYTYETGKIIYDVQKESTLGDFITVTEEGTKRFVFKDWGNLRIEEYEGERTSVITDLVTGAVTTEVETIHDLRKWDTPKSYDVNFDHETITMLDFSPVLTGLTNDELVDAIAPDEVEPLTADGVKIIALTSCTNYVINEFFTQCINEGAIDRSGIELESIFSTDTAFTTETATSVHFDVFVDDSEFDIPNYTILTGN